MTIYDLAKQLQLRGGHLLRMLNEMGVGVTSLESEIDDATADLVLERIGGGGGLLQRLRRWRSTGSAGDFEAVDEDLYTLAMTASSVRPEAELPVSEPPASSTPTRAMEDKVIAEPYPAPAPPAPPRMPRPEPAPRPEPEPPPRAPVAEAPVEASPAEYAPIDLDDLLADEPPSPETVDAEPAREQRAAAPASPDADGGIDLEALLGLDAEDQKPAASAADGIDLEAILAEDMPEPTGAEDLSLAQEGIDLTSILGEEKPEVLERPASGAADGEPAGEALPELAPSLVSRAATGLASAARGASAAVIGMSWRTTALVSVGLAVIGTAILGLMVNAYVNDASRQAPSWLRRAEQLYQDGSYLVEQGYRERGLAKLAQAREYYDRIVSSPASLPGMVAARFGLADVDYALGEFSRAADHYRRAIEYHLGRAAEVDDFPQDQRRREADLRIGLCLLRLDNFEPARDHLEDVVRRYPNSETARQALAALGELHRKWADIEKKPRRYAYALEAYERAETICANQEQRAEVLQLLANTYIDMAGQERIADERRKLIEQAARQYDDAREAIERAAKTYETARVGNDERRRILDRQTKIFAQLGSWERVAANAKEILELDPIPDEAVTALERLGRAQLALGKPESAEATARELILRYSTHHDLGPRAETLAHTLLGDAYFDRSMFPDMYDAYRTAMEHPIDIGEGGSLSQRALARMAEYLFQRCPAVPERREEMLGEAIERLRSLLERYPDSQYAYHVTFQLGECHRALGQYLLAAGWYQRVIESHPYAEFLDPGDRYVEWAHFRRAECFDAIDDHRSARDAYVRAINEYPQGDLVPHATLRVAEMHRALGEFDLALGIYDEYVKRGYPDPHGEARLRHGEMRLEVFDFERGRAIFEQLTAAMPDSATAHLARRRIAESYFDEASSATGEAKLRLERNGTDIWRAVCRSAHRTPADRLALARAEVRIGSVTEAVDTMRRYLETVEDATAETHGAIELARQYRALGRHQEVIETLEHPLLRLDLLDAEETAQALFLLGEAHEALGRIDEAIEAYEQLSLEAPGSVERLPAEARVRKLRFGRQRGLVGAGTPLGAS